MFRTNKLLLPCLLLLLVGCSSPDGQTIIPFPMGGGSGGSGSSSTWPGSAPAPAEPILPPVYKAGSRDGRPEGLFEQHGAVGPAGCQAMAERFKKEGRRVTLKYIIRNYLNGGGGELTHLCLFDGPDAQTLETDVFEDYRYNSPDEYTSP